MLKGRGIWAAFAVLALLMSNDAAPSRKPSPLPKPPLSKPPSPSLSPSSPSSSPTHLTLIWSDEFQGTTLDSSSWTTYSGDASTIGTSSGEVQCYTPSAVSLDGQGSLVITSTDNGPSAGPCPGSKISNSSARYSSGRIQSKMKRAFVWNETFPLIRIEARVMLPYRNGSWPSVWLIGNSVSSTNYTPPNGQRCAWSGEIDIYEQINEDPRFHGAIHYPSSMSTATSPSCASIGQWGPYPNGTVAGTPATPNVWHIVALEWTKDQLSFFADSDQPYLTINSSQWLVPTGPAGAPFNEPYYIIVNNAVGGSWTMSDPPYSAPIEMTTPWLYKVDYIRVWGGQISPPPPSSPPVPSPPSPPMILGVDNSAKKGFVYSASDPTSPSKFEALAAQWYYNWGAAATANVPSSIPFTPMIWGKGSTSASTLSNLTVPAYKADCSQGYLLGFNEPDLISQSNLSVTQAIALWPSLMATNRCLGSPAVAQQPTNSSVWLGQFMAQVKALRYRVDFITLHWYASPNSASFLSLVRKLHTMYNLPVWVTEMAVADWSGKNPYSAQQVLNFMNSTLPVLKTNTSYGVDRFSWKTRSTTDLYMGSSALFNADGSLTAVGQLYETI